MAVQAAEPDAGVDAVAAELRLAGKLDEARSEVDAALRRPNLSATDEVALRLELAKIHDRVGLHTKTRPVVAALREIEKAEALAADLDEGTRGRVEAVKAYYYYRAEMAGRQFVTATKHALNAIDMLKAAGDTRAQGEAVHLLGLIRVYRREFDTARALFDESLELDRAAGERVWMLGEYHRHIALIHVFQGDWNAALPHYEKSLQYRIDAGAVDGSLFAALSLGRALIETGRPQEARPHLEYALRVAVSIGSKVGQERVEAVLARLESPPD